MSTSTSTTRLCAPLQIRPYSTDIKRLEVHEEPAGWVLTVRYRSTPFARRTLLGATGAVGALRSVERAVGKRLYWEEKHGFGAHYFVRGLTSFSDSKMREELATARLAEALEESGKLA
jgi:hypothetical protein